MDEQIELRNEGDRSFYAKACRSKLSGHLFIHIGTEPKQVHGESKKILPHDYEILTVDEVEG